MKRILLFLGTNLAVVLVLSIVARLLGLDRLMAQQGGMGGLLIFSALFGFGGSLISLAMSKFMAKRAMGVRVIAQPANNTEQWLVSTVRSLAEQAGIGMPEVGIFDSPQPNAFATGARRDASLVAVSTGLLRSMKPNEVEAVLGHEIAHVANGDMVTLTLLQGIVNTFVIFLSRIAGEIIDRAVFRSENGRGIGYFASVMICQIVFGVLASIIVMWFSRHREFRADAGGAKAAGSGNMIAALERLKSASNEPLPGALNAFGIGGGAGAGLKKLFMSHPPLDERIAALRASANG
ncbi:MAG: protease HtpX [Nevskiaceae bacterium]|jgi:heat shock protein HtpX|nr:protease HtpX [Nevskiaceae bacterium]